MKLSTALLTATAMAGLAVGNHPTRSERHAARHRDLLLQPQRYGDRLLHQQLYIHRDKPNDQRPCSCAICRGRPHGFRAYRRPRRLCVRDRRFFQYRRNTVQRQLPARLQSGRRRLRYQRHDGNDLRDCAGTGNHSRTRHGAARPRCRPSSEDLNRPIQTNADQRSEPVPRGTGFGLSPVMPRRPCPALRITGPNSSGSAATGRPNGSRSVAAPATRLAS